MQFAELGRFAFLAAFCTSVIGRFALAYGSAPHWVTIAEAPIAGRISEEWSGRGRR